MKLSGIVSVSGRSGLFKVIAKSKNSVIIESLIDKKRFTTRPLDRVSELENISIYTYDEEVPLKVIYKGFAEKENCGASLSHKEELTKLSAYLLEILPDYDQERVYSSDIKKIFQWYNILQGAGLITIEEEEVAESKTEETEEAEKKQPSEKKETAKTLAKAPIKKTPTKKVATTSTKSKATKPTKRTTNK